MQIREQGQQVQLIRSPYDPVKKRCVQTVFLKFKRQYVYSSANLQDYLSAQQIEMLSDSEKAHLSDWLKAKADKHQSDDAQSAIWVSETSLKRLADAILSDHGKAMPPEKIAAIWDGLDAVAKAMKKQKHVKPAKADKVVSAKQTSTTDARQTSLLSDSGE